MRDETSSLLQLWHGDADSLGYRHEEIVVRVCELETPPSSTFLLALFYPGTVVGDVEPEDAEMLQSGFDLWVRRQTLNAKARSVLDRVRAYTGG